MNQNTYNMDEAYAFFMAGIPGMGKKAQRKLLDYAKTPKQVYELTEKELGKVPGLSEKQIRDFLKWQKNFRKEYYEEYMKKGIHVLWREHPDYPGRLQNIPDPPEVLFYKGHLPAEGLVHVAVVGARDCTEYGRHMAATLGRELAEAGACVVSGMARGVDGISQRIALREGGRSVAVLGNGVDVCYPPSNQDVYNRLETDGCIMSEYMPGTQPAAGLFPARNRIISGLADALVVVEAREKSGTLITVDMALEQGKEVYVIPGRVTDALSRGCNDLIRQGAEIITSVPAFIDHICGGRTPQERPVEGENCEEALEQKLLSVLAFEPKRIDEIWALLQKEEALSMQSVMMLLLRLQMKGRVTQLSQNCFSLRA